MKEKNEDVKKAENKLKSISNGIADISLSYKNLEQQTAKSKNELDKNTVVLNAECEKGREIQDKIASV